MNSIDAIATIFDEARARAPSVPTRSIEEVAADIDSLVAPRARPQEADDVYASATRGLRGASLSLENEQLFELWLAKADRPWPTVIDRGQPSPCLRAHAHSRAWFRQDFVPDWVVGPDLFH